MAIDVNHLKAALQRDVDALRQTSQELRVQAHLARADLKVECDRLELLLRRVQEDVARMGEHVKTPLHDMEAALRKLIDEIGHGFSRVRAALQADVPG
ncbi:MAG: hypothetical protein ABW321_15615 [Polyangiales bacterium]